MRGDKGLGGLQQDLKWPAHPVTAWLTARFPHRDAWRRRWQLRAAEPERATTSGPATLGKAFEYCVGLDLSAQVPYARRLACLPGEHARWLLSAAGFAPDGTQPVNTGPMDGSGWRRVRPAGALPSRPARLRAAAWYLACLDDLLYEDESGRNARRPVAYETAAGGLRPSFRRAATALRSLWNVYATAARPPLLTLGPVQTAPVLVPGYATGDLLAGTTLVEIKTGWLDSPEDVDQALCQVLAYGLLAVESQHDVTAVAVYAARFGMVLVDSLEPLACELAGGRVDLATAGADLRAVVESRPAGK